MPGALLGSMRDALLGHDWEPHLHVSFSVQQGQAAEVCDHSRIRGVVLPSSIPLLSPEPGSYWELLPKILWMLSRDGSCLLESNAPFLNAWLLKLRNCLPPSLLAVSVSPVCASHCPRYRDTMLGKTVPAHALRYHSLVEKLSEGSSHSIYFPVAEPFRVWPWWPSGREGPPDAPEVIIPGWLPPPESV